MPEEPVVKLTFEKTEDFKFMIAYEAYSKCFDPAPSDDTKKTLNSLITKLFNNEITYPRFYEEIARYREVPDTRGLLRARIEVKSKREYRRDEQKTERIRRFKK